MALYSNMVVYGGGALLSHNTEVDTTLSADDQDVETIPLGYDGVSPSPEKRTISCTNVVPVSGFEVDLEAKFMAREEIEMKLQQIGSGKSCVSKGTLRSVNMRGGVGATMTLSFEFTGTPGIFK